MRRSRSLVALLAAAAAVTWRPAEAAQPAGPPGEAAWKKLAPYTRCVNTSSQQVSASLTSYAEWCNLKKGPSKGDGFASWGIDAVGPVGECTEGLSRAAALSPRMPDLEAAAESYARALRQIASLVNEAHDYYGQGDFKDDGMARGKAMHPRLMAAWDGFFAADAALREHVEVQHDRLQDEELAWLEKSGQRLAYLRAKTMRLAKNLVRAVKAPRELDVAQFQPRLEAYQAGLGELEAFLGSHTVEGVQAYLYPEFLETGKDYLASAKELVRHKRGNVKLEGQFAERRRGHPAQVIGTYNDLVDRSNQLQP